MAFVSAARGPWLAKKSEHMGFAFDESTRMSANTTTAVNTESLLVIARRFQELLTGV